MAEKRWVTLGELFDWPYEDPIGLYPFEARCLAVDWNPEAYPELLELGKGVIDFIYSRSTRVPRQVKHGRVTIYFPERWLSVKEKLGLMQALCDLHEDYPLKYVHIITGEPVILTDFCHTQVRVMRDA